MREMLQRMRIVLCQPSHPGNIGAAARAMKTMGLDDLRLVAPRRFPAPEATAMASMATDVLDQARTHVSLDEAIGDCAAAFALSARVRERSPRVLSVREAALAARERAAQGPVAFVFGNETAGLSNDEMFKCQFLVHIPTAPGCKSLNLAQAVQVVTYELLVAQGIEAPAARSEPLATVADMAGLFRHLDEAGAMCGFYDPADPKRLPERWRRLFTRIGLEREEVNVLRGMLRSLMKLGEKPDANS